MKRIYRIAFAVTFIGTLASTSDAWASNFKYARSLYSNLLYLNRQALLEIWIETISNSKVVKESTVSLRNVGEQYVLF